ncbi:HD domain-containing protein [Desulfospira joergensenii]|uniref:HD domain-containing protein n=1 Tax=Desulfospira joergensenii TaxID=53329 RepID=UPI0003FD6F4B|nr:HD domain-containing protein [Desulfospira joergensenii]
MDPFLIIDKYYAPGSRLSAILKDHGVKVAEKSLEIAGNLPASWQVDLDFIEKAAILHDIGIFKTRSESIGCNGDLPYICHGFLGRQILDQEGLDPAYGLVAERHTGAGITLSNIIRNDLPLPQRDMVPVSLAEKIICCADKYFSKSPPKNNLPMTAGKITEKLEKISPDHARRFAGWAEEFQLG